MQGGGLLGRAVAALVAGLWAAASVHAQDSRGDWEIEFKQETSAKPAILVPYQIVRDEIPEPLTGRLGDATRGRIIALDRDEGNCLACHSIPIPEEQFHGTIGPDLRGIASRMTPGQLRLRIVNPKLLNPKSLMPAYYKNKGLYRVRADVRGKPILEAQDIEDLIAFLKKMTK